MESNAPHFKIGVSTTNSAADGSVCELYFTDAIYNKVNFWSGEEISMLQECIDKVNECKPNKIVQYIDSWGGSAPVGFGIYNFLRQHSAKVETVILNNCASIATVIAAAGNKGKISMPRNGMMVIHQAQNSAQGTSKDLREAAEICDKYTENVLDVYVQTNRKGKTRDELYALIADGDYWMTGTEALEMGFVDSVYNDEAVTITNSIASAKKVYNNIPQRILDMAEDQPNTESGGFFKQIKNYFDMKVAEIKAAFTDKLPNNGIIGTGEHALDIKALLGPSIDALVDNLNTQLTAEIAEATTTATNAVTAGVSQVEAKYKDIIDGLGTKIDDLVAKVADLTTTNDTQAGLINAQDATIKNLTADITALQGRPAPAAGNNSDPATAGNNGAKPKLTFAGKTTPVNVAD